MFPTDWFPAPDVYAFTSKKKMRKLAKKHGNKIDDFDTYGRTVSFYDDKGNLKVYVYITPNVPKKQMESLIAHESVHIAQNWADMMLDNRPSEEFMAYAVQSSYMLIRKQLKL